MEFSGFQLGLGYLHGTCRNPKSFLNPLKLVLRLWNGVFLGFGSEAGSSAASSAGSSEPVSASSSEASDWDSLPFPPWIQARTRGLLDTSLGILGIRGADWDSGSETSLDSGSEAGSTDPRNLLHPVDFLSYGLIRFGIWTLPTFLAGFLFFAFSWGILDKFNNTISAASPRGMANL